MVRREDAISDAAVKGDAALLRNPGCAGVWITRSFRVFRAPGASATGYLITMGNPERVEWYAAGRDATRAEVLHSIDTGMPLLEAQCDRQKTAADRHDAHLALIQARAAVDVWLPA
jgi:hypothetical protein